MMRPSEVIFVRRDGAGEHLEMVDWMLERASATDKAIREKAYARASYSWIPRVLNRRVPLLGRWALLRERTGH